MTKFRFQDLEIWTEAISLGDLLFDIADSLEERNLLSFAEQLRSAGMSVSNNIAEGSGSSSQPEFKQFLNISKRSTFEIANILIILHRRKVIESEMFDNYLKRLDMLGRKITNFQKGIE